MFRGCAVMVMAVLVALPSKLFADPSPADVVTSFHATLLGNMKRAATLGCKGRSQAVAAAVDADFDLRFIAQRILRRQWSSLSEDQRTQFVAVFHDLVIGTYASQFSGFSGETFNTLDTVDGVGGDMLVHTQLTTRNQGKVELDYALNKSAEPGSNWRIVNVIADGVSDLALRSTQYDKLFKESGYDGLMAWIREQKKKTLAECS